jgi:Rieske Fe-S protein
MSERDPDRPSVAPDGTPEPQQPAWRRDFPIDWPQDHYVARRDFTKFLGLTSLAFVTGQLWIGVKSWLDRREPAPGRQRIAPVDEVRPGRPVVFHYPTANDPCLLLHAGEGPLPFVAYSQKCTHLACAVVPGADGGSLHCPCHNGHFDLQSGRPTAGPPRRPLPRITLEVVGGVVYATGVEVSPT